MLKKFHNFDDFTFKEKFIERYSKLTDFEQFKLYSLSFPRKSIRVNTLKIPVKELVKKLEDNWTLTPIPWCKEGFWIEGVRRDIGNLPEHVLGYIYVQDSASMIPPIVLKPKPGEHVLDVAAAPGSKTTQMGMYMKNKGMIVANDVSHTRLASLGVNVQRCGLSNIVLTMMYGQNFKRVGFEFDKILLDAPCSGTGTIRKSPKTINIWNPDMVRRVATTQRSLLDANFSILKRGGVLTYSTCTMEPEENEGVITEFLENHDDAKLEKFELDIKRSEPVLEFEGQTYSKEVKKCLRIWPQDNDTEGFFVAKIKKSR